MRKLAMLLSQIFPTDDASARIREVFAALLSAPRVEEEKFGQVGLEEDQWMERAEIERTV